jgi:hypothetical protein
VCRAPPGATEDNPFDLASGGGDNVWSLMEFVAQPSAAYLQQLVRAIMAEPAMPIAIRNECHKLMLAIDRNDRPLITESVGRIEKLAAEAKVTLPPPSAW